MTSAFEILPAIDLRGGRVVRLRAGRLRARDGLLGRPGRVARAVRRRRGALAPRRRPRRGADRGAGTRRGDRRPSSRRSAIGVAGRGGRWPADGGFGRAVLAAGAARVVVGTAALRDPAFAGTPGRGARSRRVAVAIDVRGRSRPRRRLARRRGRLAPRTRCGASPTGRDHVRGHGHRPRRPAGGPDLDLLERLLDSTAATSSPRAGSRRSTTSAPFASSAARARSSVERSTTAASTSRRLSTS